MTLASGVNFSAICGTPFRTDDLRITGSIPIDFANSVILTDCNITPIEPTNEPCGDTI